MNNASFKIEVSLEDALRFAEISGDWNPLHTDPVHAAKTSYKKTILHGAFSAGLISRMAGMYIPGADCLLHNMRLRFIAPIIPPAVLNVSAELVLNTGGVGRVEANVSDDKSGVRYVEAVYEFGHHEIGKPTDKPLVGTRIEEDERILVTGASGGIGRALLRRLGPKGLGISRSDLEGSTTVSDLSRISEFIDNKTIKGIVHCAWPAPDNVPFTKLEQAEQAIYHHLAAPMGDIQALSRLLIDQGVENAPLILIGSTFAEKGRHNFRMPLYSLAKSIVPALTSILAMELAPHGRRCITVVFDVIDGGMNQGLNEGMRLSHSDRSPSGELATPDDAAAQISWLLENQSRLITGATVTLSGGAMP